MRLHRPAITALLALTLAAIAPGASLAAPTRDPAGGFNASTADARSCATPEPTAADRDAMRSAIARVRTAPLVAGGPVTIPIAFHVLTFKGAGNVSDDQIAAEVDELNTDYAAFGFRFRLRSVDRTDRNDWFTMGPGTGAEKQCKMTLAVDPAHTLNVYTASLPHSLLGWAYFPFSLPENSFFHGVVIHYGSLPGGPIPNYNLGRTLTHETGHYLGLFHTFQGGCVPPGDEIDDTPFEASPAFGCPVGRNTCPQEGDDPIHNYMDYTYDACYTEFTADQETRMHDMVAAYRPSLLNGPIAQAATRPVGGPALAAPVAGEGVEFAGAAPNPFSRSTLFRFALPAAGRVNLSLYNVAGQRVATVIDGERDAGPQMVSFAPRGLPAGMYFAVLQVGGVRIARTAALIP